MKKNILQLIVFFYFLLEQTRTFVMYLIQFIQ